MKPITVAGPRPIYTALPHFPGLLDFSLSLRPVAKPVNERRSKSRGLTVLPVGFALFHERPQAFLGIFEPVKLVQENVHGIFQAVAQRETHPAENRLFCHGENRPGMPGDARANVVDCGFELRFGNQAIHDPEIERTLGSDRFPKQHELESYLRPDEKGKNRGRKRRKDPDRDFWLSETRFGRSDNQVAKGGQLRAATDRRTVDYA